MVGVRLAPALSSSSSALNLNVCISRCHAGQTKTQLIGEKPEKGTENRRYVSREKGWRGTGEGKREFKKMKVDGEKERKEKDREGGSKTLCDVYIQRKKQRERGIIRGGRMRKRGIQRVI